MGVFKLRTVVVPTLALVAGKEESYTVHFLTLHLQENTYVMATQ